MKIENTKKINAEHTEAKVFYLTLPCLLRSPRLYCCFVPSLFSNY